MKRQFSAAASLVVALAAISLPGSSRAGGFYVNELGTPSMGTAGAGANARADDASTAFHGPAGMTRLGEHQLMLGVAPSSGPTWATLG